MAIKKKVTYSVSYTAGTDTLTTQLNSLLQDIVTLILSQNTGLQTLDTITVGSDRWTGAPLYDTYVSGLNSATYNNRHYQSDVIFIGTNEDNLCLSIGFFDGQLVVAMNMTPKVEKMHTDVWASEYGLNTLAFYATGKMSRWFADANAMLGNYAIPYVIANNTISMSVIYWNEEYSRGYSFVNGAGQSDGVDLVIFNTDEGNNQSGLGAAIWCYGTYNGYHNAVNTEVTVFSFAENLSENRAQILQSVSNQTSSYTPTLPAEDVMQQLNCRMDLRAWMNVNNSGTTSYKVRFFACMHTLGTLHGNVTLYDYQLMHGMPKISNTWTSSNETKYFLSPLLTAYNLPHLNPGQAYVRKMRIPGWNPDCKGEIYLLWSPVLTAYQSGDIVEVGSKSYAIITEGAVCWAARVS